MTGTACGIYPREMTGWATPTNLSAVRAVTAHVPAYRRDIRSSTAVPAGVALICRPSQTRRATSSHADLFSRQARQGRGRRRAGPAPAVADLRHPGATADPQPQRGPR